LIHLLYILKFLKLIKQNAPLLKEMIFYVLDTKIAERKTPFPDDDKETAYLTKRELFTRHKLAFKKIGKFLLENGGGGFKDIQEIFNGDENKNILNAQGGSDENEDITIVRGGDDDSWIWVYFVFFVFFAIVSNVVYAFFLAFIPTVFYLFLVGSYTAATHNTSHGGSSSSTHEQKKKPAQKSTKKTETKKPAQKQLQVR